MQTGTLTIMLGVTTSGMNKAIRDVNRLERSVVGSAASMNAAMLSFGRTMTQFVTFPTAVIGGVATRLFSNFEYELSKVTGLVQIASEQTKAWGEELKNLSPQVAKSPQELAEALYFVTTGGMRGAETMGVLTQASKAAAAGLGETKDVVDILVSVMNAYGKENINAAKAADILVASVREGKAEAPELVRSIGIVLPIASKLGASFDQVGAAMAAMTRTGTKASTAGMQVRQMLNKIVKPAQQSHKAIERMGSSFEELRNIVATEGILPMLLKVKELTEQEGITAMAELFPRIRSLIGVLDILGENLDENLKAQEAITNSAGALNHAFSIVSKTWKFQLNQAIKEGQSLFISIGESITKVLLPAVKKVLDALGNWRNSFDNLSTPMQNLIVKWGLLATVMGPVIILGNMMYKTFVTPIIGIYIAINKWIISLQSLAATQRIIYAQSIAGTKGILKGILKVRIALNALMASNPVGWVMLIVGAVAALSYGITRVVKKSRDLTEEQKKLKEVNQEVARTFLSQKRTLDILVESATNKHASDEMRTQAIRRLNDLAPEYLRNLTEENIALKEGKNILDIYTASLERKTRAEVASNVMIKLQEERIDALAKGTDKHITKWQIVKANYKGAVNAGMAFWKAGEKINEQFEKFGKINAAKAAKEYEDALEALEKMVKRNSHSLEDLTVAYEYLNEQSGKAKDQDSEFTQELIKSIKQKIKYAQEYIAILKEQANVQPYEFAYPDVSVDMPKMIGGEGWVYEFFQLDRFGDDLEKAEEYVIKMEALAKRLADIFKTQKEEEKLKIRQDEIKEFWEDYDNKLKAAERANTLLGDSFDYLNEVLKIYESTLKEVSKEDDLFEHERTQEVKRHADTLRLAINLTKDLANEREELINTWEREMEVEAQTAQQTQEINGLFMQAIALANTWGLSLEGLTNHFFDTNKAAEEFKEVLDKLEVLNLRGLISDEQLKILQDLFNIAKVGYV